MHSGAEPPAGRATQGPPADWMLANDASTTLVHEVYQESAASVSGGAAELEEEMADLALAQPEGKLTEAAPKPTKAARQTEGAVDSATTVPASSTRLDQTSAPTRTPAMTVTAHGLLPDAWPERDEVGGAEAMAMRKKEVE